jgi:hypothetical protein
MHIGPAACGVRVCPSHQASQQEPDTLLLGAAICAHSQSHVRAMQSSEDMPVWMPMWDEAPSNLACSKHRARMILRACMHVMTATCLLMIAASPSPVAGSRSLGVVGIQPHPRFSRSKEHWSLHQKVGEHLDMFQNTTHAGEPNRLHIAPDTMHLHDMM